MAKQIRDAAITDAERIRTAVIYKALNKKVKGHAGKTKQLGIWQPEQKQQPKKEI